MAETALTGVRSPDGLEWVVRSWPNGDVAVPLNHTDRTSAYQVRQFAPYESRIVPL